MFQEEEKYRIEATYCFFVESQANIKQLPFCIFYLLWNLFL